PTAEATLTDFLRDPNSIVEKLERQDVVLHRRNAADLRLSLQSRSEADDEGVRFIAHLLGQALTDDVVGARLVSAAAAIPWVTFLPERSRHTFVEELIRTAEAAGELGSMAPLAQLLVEWKATAAIHTDPALAVELKRPIAEIGSRVPAPSGD
ncbi:MAG: hypothetical protein Q7S35_06135, partial [Candidatus Limnocylindrales bacterium]|nr:hypothetical protein [Candidatus Limnocylindrales bacterium]